VLVLERRELLGGCSVTEEVWPGYRVSTAAYLTSLMQERIVANWNSSASATSWTPRIRPSSPIFPDGRHLFMWQDGERTLEEIAKFSQRDAERYPAYVEQMERLARVVESRCC
jgi:phytoene dehydrogenase-like protein